MRLTRHKQRLLQIHDNISLQQLTHKVHFLGSIQNDVHLRGGKTVSSASAASTRKLHLNTNKTWPRVARL